MVPIVQSLSKFEHPRSDYWDPRTECYGLLCILNEASLLIAEPVPFVSYCVNLAGRNQLHWTAQGFPVFAVSCLLLFEPKYPKTF